MQLMGMMAGGVVGVLVFGEHSWGFYICVAIGAFAAFASKQRAASKAPEGTISRPPIDQAPDDGQTLGPPKISSVERTSNSEASLFGTPGPITRRKMASRMTVILLLLVAGAIGAYVVSPFERPISPSRSEEAATSIVTTRQAIAADIWDPNDCIRGRFPQVAFMSPPPEVEMFCSHRWNDVALAKLRNALRESHISFADFMPGQPEIAAALEAAPDKEVLDFGLLTRILPVAKAGPSVLVTLKASLPAGLYEKINTFRGLVIWNDDPTAGGLIRYRLSRDIIMVSDQFDLATIRDLADSFFVYGTIQATVAQTMGQAPLQYINRRGILSPTNSFTTLMFLQVTIGASLELVTKPDYKTSWTGEGPTYEIYFTDVLADWPCGNVSVHEKRPALLCADDNRLFVSVKRLAAIGDIYPRYAGKSILNLPPAFFHELAHVLWDPAERKSQPFIAEGLATAEGERSLRILKAAVSKADDPAMTSQIPGILSGTAPTANDLLTVDDLINDQPFTVFETGAICDVIANPPRAEYVIRQMEMPFDFFNNRSDAEVMRAYHVAWLLFQYGIDERVRPMRSGHPDLSFIRYLGNRVAQNHPVAVDELERLKAFLADVQKLAQYDFERKKPQCPSEKT